MLEHSEFESIHFWKVARSYLGKYIYSTGFYLVGDTLVDCGPANAIGFLSKLFRALPMKKVLVTHHHEDHTGNAGHILKAHGITPLAHPKSAVALSRIPSEIPIWRKLTWGTPTPVEMKDPGREVVTSFCALQVIETPGHSEDHLCFFEPQRRWLFTGDLFLSTYLRYLRDDEDIHGIMRSLRAMIELKPSVLFCNHRGPVMNGEAALAKKLAFLEDLQERVLDAVRKGTPEQDLVAQLMKKDRFFSWFTSGEFCSLNLIRALGEPPRHEDTKN